MRFRFTQTGDLHVGRGRSSWGEEASLARADKLFDELYKAAHEQKCHALLITGDIFDRKNVTNEERELVARKLTLHSDQMPTFVISGNHDLMVDNKKKTNSNLDFLAEITENTKEIPNLHISFADRVSVWEAPGAPGLFIAGASGPVSENQAKVEEFAARLGSGSGQYIFMGHGSVKFCMRNDALWRPKESDDKGISLAKAGLTPNIIWWAYGDIHKRQKLPTLPKGANGWYAGSPIQMDFGETPDRGALVVACDFDGSKWKYKGKRYVRLDDRGFAPLVTVTSEEEIDGLPKEALLRLAKGLVLPEKRHHQVVSTLRVVEDRSTPEAAVKAVGSDGDELTLEAFDPLLADLGAVEADVLAELDPDDEVVRTEARKVVGLAVERYRERTFVS